MWFVLDRSLATSDRVLRQISRRSVVTIRTEDIGDNLVPSELSRAAGSSAPGRCSQIVLHEADDQDSVVDLLMHTRWQASTCERLMRLSYMQFGHKR